MVGWERLQGNAFIKEGEVELISNKQGSSRRREEAPTALSHATGTGEDSQTGRMQWDVVGRKDMGPEAGSTLVTRGVLAGREGVDK